MLGAAPAHAARLPDADQAFLTARDAFRANDEKKLARAAQATGGHVLEPWVGYWQLRLRLEDRAAENVQWYLTRNAGSLLAEQLRRDWLKVLGKKGDWTHFNEQAPLVVGDDPDIACYALQSRWRLAESSNQAAGRDNNVRDESVLAEVRTYWNAPKELPEGCVPLANALLQSGKWGATQVWMRVRLLADANLLGAARRALDHLPRGEMPDMRQFDAALNSPVRALEIAAALATRTQRELYLIAVTRVARNDPLLAMSYWQAKVRAQFPAEDNAWLLTQVATTAARKLMPEAVAWFAQAEAADAAMGLALNDEQQAWRVRIAMRQDSWSEVRAAIERMSTQARNDPAWIYWMGRALRASAGPVQTPQPPVSLNAPPNAQQLARAQFARIAGDYSYYGRLAAEELGLPMQLPPPAAGASADEMAAAAANPGLRRALALYRLDMRTEGTREWAWSIRGMDDRSLLAAAELARRNELWDRAINTADRTIASHDFNLRYLAPYRDILAGAAKARALEEPLVLGLVRQESRFISGAKSGVGASGLMQLMPATAKWVAHKLGLKDYSWARVHEPAVNAQLGTAYLRQVLDDLDGFPVLAAAAYNAGPGRARKWRDTRPLEGAVYVESIPFNETRDYVKKVMANTVFYSAVLGGEPVSLKARLGTIAARSGADRLAALKDDPTP